MIYLQQNWVDIKKILMIVILKQFNLLLLKKQYFFSSIPILIALSYTPKSKPLPLTLFRALPVNRPLPSPRAAATTAGDEEAPCSEKKISLSLYNINKLILNIFNF